MTTTNVGTNVSEEMFSSKSIRIRQKPGMNKIDDDYYMEKSDTYLFTRLKQVENPKVCDFERLFSEFEIEFFNEIPKIMQVVIDMSHPKHARMMMALTRYTE